MQKSPSTHSALPHIQVSDVAVSPTRSGQTGGNVGVSVGRSVGKAEGLPVGSIVGSGSSNLPIHISVAHVSLNTLSAKARLLEEIRIGFLLRLVAKDPSGPA